ETVGWTAPATQYRACGTQEPAHTDPGRGHISTGLRVRTTGAGSTCKPNAGPNRHRDCAPAEYYSTRRRDCGNSKWYHRGTRSPPRPNRTRRAVPEAA